MIKHSLKTLAGASLQAKSLIVAVRCYEARTGRRGTTHSNLLAEYSTLLWHAPATAAAAPQPCPWGGEVAPQPKLG